MNSFDAKNAGTKGKFGAQPAPKQPAPVDPQKAQPQPQPKAPVPAQKLAGATNAPQAPAPAKQ